MAFHPGTTHLKFKDGSSGKVKLADPPSRGGFAIHLSTRGPERSPACLPEPFPSGDLRHTGANAASSLSMPAAIAVQTVHCRIYAGRDQTQRDLSA